ncbi:MAG: PilT/PilU family type 4a pilus ATPase [Candidatus Kerfeldbacteria bacterium]|nr:PilT/PilU family type 4a pilus ATPase [Candidatus Kerfeldbacteria bacterium]
MSTSESIIIQRILTTAAEYRASDLHLTTGNPPILRVDGKLVILEQEQMVTPDFMDVVKEMFLTPEQQAVLKQDREITVAYTLENRIRFKVSMFFQRGYLAASLRLISNEIKPLRELGLPPIVQEFTKLTKGLLLITGPFGSGRTATVAAVVNEINKTRSAHVITIEKPIEHVYVNDRSFIEQREVGRDTKSFEQALETAIREDVDVIVVSEMVEPPVIQAVLTAAESSRLVISTMNTDSVMKTVESIINSAPADLEVKTRQQLAGTLQGIVSQRLLPRVGGGRILVAEVMAPSPPIRAVIRDGALFQLQNILQTSRESGTISLDRSLAELVKTGEILVDDALVYAVDPNNLKMWTRS